MPIKTLSRQPRTFKVEGHQELQHPSDPGARLLAFVKYSVTHKPAGGSTAGFSIQAPVVLSVDVVGVIRQSKPREGELLPPGVRKANVNALIPIAGAKPVAVPRGVEIFVKDVPPGELSALSQMVLDNKLRDPYWGERWKEGTLGNEFIQYVEKTRVARASGRTRRRH